MRVKRQTSNVNRPPGMMRKVLREWWTWWRLRQEARGYVRANGLPVVCSAMWLLNRRAPASHWKGEIYRMKDVLLRELCARVPYEVYAERSVKECWHCWEYSGDGDCPACGGTGIYARRDYWCFVFRVGGRRFAWHAPAGRVTWKLPAWRGDWRTFESGARRDIPAMPAVQELTLLAVVWEGLQWCGVRPAEIRDAALLDGWQLGRTLGEVVMVARWRLGCWLRGRRRMPRVGRWCWKCGARTATRFRCTRCEAVRSMGVW